MTLPAVILLPLLAAAALLALRRLHRVVRDGDRRRLFFDARGVAGDMPDRIGISVLCSGVSAPAQVENLLSPEFARYEVVLVLDSRRYPVEFAALTARYRMIGVEYRPSEELPASGIRAVARSRRRCYRRLVLVDRAQDTPAGDLDAAAGMAAYDYWLPVGPGQYLLRDAVDRLAAEIGGSAYGEPEFVRFNSRTSAALFFRETVVGAGGFGADPGRHVPRRRRRIRREPLFRPPAAGRRVPAGAKAAAGIALAAGIGLAAAFGAWLPAAVLVTAALVWSAAACAAQRAEALAEYCDGRRRDGTRSDD